MIQSDDLKIKDVKIMNSDIGSMNFRDTLMDSEK